MSTKHMHWFLPQAPDVLGMLRRHAEITVEGVDELVAWARGDAEAAERCASASTAPTPPSASCARRWPKPSRPRWRWRTSSSSRAESTKSSTTPRTWSARPRRCGSSPTLRSPKCPRRSPPARDSSLRRSAARERQFHWRHDRRRPCGQGPAPPPAHLPHLDVRPGRNRGPARAGRAPRALPPPRPHRRRTRPRSRANLVLGA